MPKSIHHNGLVKVPFKGDDILGAMAVAWESVINDAEPDIGEPGSFLRFGCPEDVVLGILHGIGVRVLRVESTISPDHWFAVVEVTGEWVDHEGESHVFLGEDDVKEREALAG